MLALHPLFRSSTTAQSRKASKAPEVFCTKAGDLLLQMSQFLLKSHVRWLRNGTLRRRSSKPPALGTWNWPGKGEGKLQQSGSFNLLWAQLPASGAARLTSLERSDPHISTTKK